MKLFFTILGIGVKIKANDGLTNYTHKISIPHMQSCSRESLSLTAAQSEFLVLISRQEPKQPPSVTPTSQAYVTLSKSQLPQGPIWRAPHWATPHVVPDISNPISPCFSFKGQMNWEALQSYKAVDSDLPRVGERGCRAETPCLITGNYAQLWGPGLKGSSQPLCISRNAKMCQTPCSGLTRVFVGLCCRHSKTSTTARRSYNVEHWGQSLRKA